MNTRRYPRTLQEAFGPYTSRHIEPMPGTEPRWTPVRAALAIVYAITLVTFVWAVWK